MRPIAPVLLACLVPLPSAAVASPAAACETRGESYDSRDVSCVVPAAAEARRYEFVARFSGGHDDTRATLVATVGGRPFRCEEGSKMDLFGEDGEVSLFCRFGVPAAAQAAGSPLRVDLTVRWSHAQYTDFELTAAR